MVAFAGAGALLGGLVLTAMKLNRRRAWRSRRPDRLIAAIPPELRGTEAAVLEAGTAAHADTTWLDQALRSLVQSLADDPHSHLPDVVAVRMTAGELELVLAAPLQAAPPAPWRLGATGSRWLLARAAPLPSAQERRTDFFAPFPTLVCIGSTAPGEHWLLDLERVGALSLVGDERRCLDLARHLALELAHSTWAEMLSVTLVGFGEELVPANPGRLSYAADVDRAILIARRRHDAVTTTSSRLGVDVLTGRLHDINGDAWASHVLLVAPHVAREPGAMTSLLHAMRASGERAAVAVVLADGLRHPEARWELVVDPEGRTDIPALGVKGLTAVAVPPHEGRAIAQLLAETANTQDRAVPAADGTNTWDAWYADACGGLRPGVATSPSGPPLTLVPAFTPDGPPDRTGSVDPVTPTADETGRPVTWPAPAPEPATGEPVTDSGAGAQAGGSAVRPSAPDADTSVVPAAPIPAQHTVPIDAEPDPTGGTAGGTTGGRAEPFIAEDVRRQLLGNDPNLDRDLADWRDPACPRPKVTVLGPTRVRAQGSLPADRPRPDWHTEVVIYLVLMSHGVTGERARADLYTSDPGQKKIRDVMAKVRQWLGPEYLPEANATGSYQLVGVLYDGELFRRLRLRAAAAAGAERAGYLQQALDLVQGEPFTGRGQREFRGYRFLTANPLDEIMRAAIEDVSHELATYHLSDADGADPEQALAAADIALLSGSHSDRPLLDKLMSCDRLGRSAEAEAYVTQILSNHADAEEEEDLPKETFEVLLSLKNRLSSAS